MGMQLANCFMTESILYVVSAYVLCLILVYFFRPICLRLSHVDKPGGRKRHVVATPLSGGLAIVSTILIIGALFDSIARFEGFSLGLVLLVVLGALDDRQHVPAMVRLAVQTAAAAFGMCALGNVVLGDLGNLFGTGNIQLGAWGVAFTVFSAVGIINAVNMIDGVDGLAGGFSLLVLLILSFLAIGSGSVDIVIFSCAIGAIGGFLTTNLRLPWQRHARAFLGDAGSLVLGFMVAWFLVRASQGSTMVIRPITAVWLISLPLMDTCYLMSARVIRGKSPFAADRYHFHHLLLRSGMSQSWTLYVWLLVAGTLALIGVLAQEMSASESMMCILFFATFCIYCWIVTAIWRFLGSSRSMRSRRVIAKNLSRRELISSKGK